MTKLYLGPVLSFRGTSVEGDWAVTALVGVDSKAKTPVLTLDGTQVKPPVVLLEHAGKKYLRYDLSCKQKKEERVGRSRAANLETGRRSNLAHHQMLRQLAANMRACKQSARQAATCSRVP